MEADQNFLNSEISDNVKNERENDFLEANNLEIEDETKSLELKPSNEETLKYPKTDKHLLDHELIDTELKSTNECVNNSNCKPKEREVIVTNTINTETNADVLNEENHALFRNIEGEINVGVIVEDVSDRELVSGDIPKGLENKVNEKKLRKISEALEVGNTEYLKKIAIYKGGLLSDNIRKKAWPEFVGVDIVNKTPIPTTQEIEAHPYYGQVVLDVNRSLKRFPPSIKETQRLTMLDQLVILIMRVLCKHPQLHYYQGYHDICVTFLLVLGEETAFHVLDKLSITHLETFMEKDMEPTIHVLDHMYTLIGSKSPKLKSFLLKSEVGIAYCLSWLITWFGHVLNNYDDVVRLFDFFIVSHPWMPMYLTAAVVLHRESGVLKQDCDMASVHSYLSNIPDNLPFEDLIHDAIDLKEDYPPERLNKLNPFIPKNTLKPKNKWNFGKYMVKIMKSVPPSRVAIIVAVGVLMASYLYQTYKQ